MDWQALAVILIVFITVTWFVRDERRRASDLALARAAKYYAHAPQYSHTWAPVPEPKRPPRRTGGLSDAQRSALRKLAAK